MYFQDLAILVTGGTGGTGAEQSIEVHDKDGQFRCIQPDYLLLPTEQHTQTSYEYTSTDRSNYLKFQVCGGLDNEASRTCQTYDDGTKIQSPSLIGQRNFHVSYSSEDGLVLVLIGGQISSTTTEILPLGDTVFQRGDDLDVDVDG